MHEITQLERIRHTQFLVDVLDGVREILGISKTNDALIKIKNYIPQYSASITYVLEGVNDTVTSVRHFTYLNRKYKGKKRTYVSMDRFKNDLYIFYMTKEKLSKLCKDRVNLMWMSDLVGNRWIVTLGNYRFKDEYQLLNHLIATELNVSRHNRPPADNKHNTWMSMRDISKIVGKYRNVGNTNGVTEFTLSEFDFNRLCSELVN